MYAVLAALHSDEIPNYRRNIASSYEPYIQSLNLNGIGFPLMDREIPIFEKNNPEISIMLYSLKNNKVDGILYKPKVFKPKHINLLYLTSGLKHHYVWIKTLSRLISSQLNSRSTVITCKMCLSHFKSSKAFDLHNAIGCDQQRVIMPKEGEQLKFKHLSSKQVHPFVIYADMEAILKPYFGPDRGDSNTSYTERSQLHVPCSYAYTISSIVDDSRLSNVRLYRGQDCISHFVDSLLNDVNYITDAYLDKIKPMESISDWYNRENSEHVRKREQTCYVCNVDLKNDDVIVWDHDHVTGCIRGKCHSSCNILVRSPRFIPLFFHNLSYDSHFFIEELAKRDLRLTCLPLTKENFISLSAHLKSRIPKKRGIEIRILDSFRFLAAPLAILAKSLGECKSFQKFQQANFPHSQLLANPQKQFFCYDYVDSFERLNEKTFPSKEKFFNKLTNESVTDENYAHAKKVFDDLVKGDLGDYYDLYLTIDCLLLQDCMSNFRDTMIQEMGLDPVFFFTLPSFSFNACLNMLPSKGINLVSDQSIASLIKGAIRGGITSSMLRYSEANNKYLKNGFDASKEEIYHAYIDVNNLYGKVLLDGFLPTSDYAWVEDANELKLISSIEFISNIAVDSPWGYIYQVDVDVDPNLHDFFNCFPFLPEHVAMEGMRKLVPNLYNKKFYVTHYRNLQQAIKYGLTLVKVHRVIKFKQTQLVQPYISGCSAKRQRDGNDEFQKKLWKDLINIIFGRFLMGDKQTIVKLTKKWEAVGRGNHNDAQRLLRDPLFHSFSICNDNLVAIQMKKLFVDNRRCYLQGFTILELSKVIMYDFFYGVLKPTLKDNLRLAYIDTDSFILQIKKVDFYKFMKAKSEYFDTSDYPVDNVYGLEIKNKKVPGLWKDEGKGMPLLRFICLKPKCYYVQFETGSDINEYEEIKKISSVNKSVTRSYEFDHFKKVLLNKTMLYAKMFRITSTKHEIHTVLMNKLSLTSKDNKRYILSDGIHTLAWGHKDIPSECEMRNTLNTI